MSKRKFVDFEAIKAAVNITQVLEHYGLAATFKKTTFDHNRDSAFKLDETHIGVDCAACHKPVQDERGAAIVRYRPLGTQCQDCHDAGMLRSRGQP